MRLQRSRTRVLALATSTLTLLTVGVLVASPAQAWDRCSDAVVDRYAQQWVNKYYKGIFGRLATYQPYTPPNPQFPETAYFSLSHLYMFRNGSSTHLEVGWHRGYGFDQPALPSSRMYAEFFDSLGDLQQLSFEVAPSGYLIYQIQYLGYIASTNRHKWGVSANGYTYDATFLSLDMNDGRVIVGGEVNQEAKSGTEILHHTAPPMQLLTQGYQWKDWTQAFLTSNGDYTGGCNDANFNFAFNSNYMDALAWGTRYRSS
jgi:hypothetical protein